MPALSWVSVLFPRIIVPEYSLSSLMSRSWIFVPRPRVRRRSPVAIGSRVPQCPTFFICRRRRTIATTSCEVIPAALSTRRTPSGVAVNDMANLLQHFLFNLGKRAAHPGAGRESVSAAAKFLADRTNIGRIRFRTHAHPHFGFRQLFQENGNDHAFNGADMIDQPFVVLRLCLEGCGGFQTQAETGNFT